MRVHKELLERQKLPKQLVGKDIWQQRFDDIRAFERHLARNGTLILKFFLNVSREEQRKRFLDRIDEPGKRWKFSMGDVIRAQALGPIHGRLRGHDPQNQHAGSALVRGAGRPQMVRPHGRGGGPWCRNCNGSTSRIPRSTGNALKELKKAAKALKAEK